MPGRSGSPPRSPKNVEHLGSVEVALVAEAGVGGDVEVDVAGAVVEPVGHLVGKERADLVGDGRDRLDGADVVGGRDDPQRFHVLAEQGDLAHGEDHPVFTVAGRAFEQRVVDVGDVLDIVHIEAVVAPDPVDEVEGQVGGRVPEMRRVVGRDAADIHLRDRRRRRGVHALAGRVVERQRHRGAGQRGQGGRQPRIHGPEPIDGRPAWWRPGVRHGRRTWPRTHPPDVWPVTIWARPPLGAAPGRGWIRPKFASGAPAHVR